ncbi:MAG: MEDS domain-containing protein [Bacteroidota bacterium]
MYKTYPDSNLQQCKTKVFWGELAPCDHIVQIYENDDVFLDLLEGFIGDGINEGDSVIVIATDVHLQAIQDRLMAHAVRVDILISESQYIPLNAEETLSKFMVNGWPDETLFLELITELTAKSRVKNRQVRAFGEMVALLWAKGHCGATVQLEHLWNKFCKTESLRLFCAYPKAGFTQEATTSLQTICETHSKVITDFNRSTTDIFYQEVENERRVKTTHF